MPPPPGYLLQVRNQRRVVETALRHYAVGAVRRLRLVNHGENTTFRLQTVDAEVTLLRLRRA